MKILMLTPRFPYPPDRGDTLRSWRQLQYLGARHDVWLASVALQRPARAHLDAVARCCRDIFVSPAPHAWRLLRGAAALIGGAPLTHGYHIDQRLVRMIARWARETEFDAVLCFSTALAPIAAEARGRRVLDMCDVDSRKWARYAREGAPLLRPLYTLEALRMTRVERDAARAFDATLLVNDRERRKLRYAARGAPRRIHVSPTCVDIAQWRPLAEQPLTRDPVVVTIGSLHYPPNAAGVCWFVKRVWPLLRAFRTDARYRIIGARPPRSVRQLARTPGVEVVADPVDIAPHLAAARVAANPVHGDLGVQSKTLVMMAAGCPSVITRDAADGLQLQRKPCLVADQPQAFAAAVASVLRDDALAERMRAAGLATIMEFYNADVELPKLETLLSTSSRPSSNDPVSSAATITGAGGALQPA